MLPFINVITGGILSTTVTYLCALPVLLNSSVTLYVNVYIPKLPVILSTLVCGNVSIFTKFIDTV